MDAFSGSAALDQVKRSGPLNCTVVVDFSQITFIDAAGITFLMKAQQMVESAGGRLVIRRASGVAVRLLELTQTAGLFEFEQPAPMTPDNFEAISLTAVNMLNEAVDFAETDMGTAQVYDPATDALLLAAHTGFGRTFVDFFEVVDQPDCACGAALYSGNPTWISEVTRSVVFAGSPALDVVVDAGVKSVASVPLRGHRGERIGMLSVHHRNEKDWTVEDRSRLLAFSYAAGRTLSAISPRSSHERP